MQQNFHTKAKDNLANGYLDKRFLIRNFHTQDMREDEIVDTTTTGSSYYNKFINSNYISNLSSKLLSGQIIEMSPNEYYELCAKYFRKGVFTIESLYKTRRNDTATLQMLKDVLLVYKKKLCMPWLNKAEHSQEGLHRMMVIGDLYGWDYKVPVLVIDFAEVNNSQ